MRTRGKLARYFVFLFSASGAIGQPDVSDEWACVRLGPVPQIKVLPSTTTAPADRDIDKLITSLAEINAPDYGLSNTLAGTIFSPIDGSAQMSTLIFTDHGLKPNPNIRKLVTLGPAALPALLKALDDRTPTKLRIDRMGIGGMWYARELESNYVHPVEKRILRHWKHEDENIFGAGREVESHTVKVGEVCFVIVGQIVGRGYCAVRYQPSGCTVINSPIEDPIVAKALRDIWTAKEPRQALLDSLLIDFSTRGVNDAKDPEICYAASRVQCGAAMRLLYYFPRESSELIAERLKKLDVTRTGPPSSQPANDSEMDAWLKREAKNGLRTDDFIKAVAWCREPAITKALNAIRERTTDEDILEAIREGRK